MSRPELTVLNVITTLRVDMDGVRVGVVHRDVDHRLVDGRKVSTVIYHAVADCRCVRPARSVIEADSEDAAAQFVRDHMRVMHAFNGTRGVA